MNVEDREKVEEFWASEFDNRSKACLELAKDWTNHHSWPSNYAAEYILRLTIQAELLRNLAIDLRRPKWVRLEPKEF